MVNAQGGTFATHEVSVRKRYRDAGTGEWKSLHSFGGSELYALANVPERAERWVLDCRTETESPT